MRGFIGFGIGIILIVIAGIYLANQDPIGKEVTHANAELAVGSSVLNDVQQGFNIIFKLIFGATLAGVGAAAFNECRKLYRMWFLDRKTRRWRSGPNARWQQQAPSPRTQNISRTDMLLMSLLGERVQGLRSKFKRPVRNDAQVMEEDLDLDL